MFKCKVCAEKDQRIADLKEQIQSLRLVINPPPRVNTYELEEDVILSGAGEEQRSIVTSEDAVAATLKAQAIQFEHDAILSGDTIEVPQS